MGHGGHGGVEGVTGKTRGRWRRDKGLLTISLLGELSIYISPALEVAVKVTLPMAFACSWWCSLLLTSTSLQAGVISSDFDRDLSVQSVPPAFTSLWWSAVGTRFSIGLQMQPGKSSRTTGQLSGSIFPAAFVASCPARFSRLHL